MATPGIPAIAYGRTLLARRAGVRKETIHRIEAGKNNPDEATFNKIEKVFKAGGVTA
jgi:DNA-binding XRE family transcriptional regulator